ncbi:MAG: 4-diphosphocytidyl-2-C-methyl-D-erythritol kinase [Methanoregulaceae archaeon PtaU1.Bin222]|nr:MAG: 4-diphosphocytidyl-2-C-methyl-D-erythritol kinase [Methanoregulaceae archaeon PtaU1.Bin222]
MISSLFRIPLISLFSIATTLLMWWVCITCTKRIPEGSGLGGGSSNAASVLRALDALFGTGLTAQSLCSLGERIGSDVPFFCSGPAALVKGRGERIRRIKPRTDFTGIAVVPDFRISTKEAYQWLDESARHTTTDTAVPERQLVSMYRCLEPAEWIFINSFTWVLEQRFPVYKKLFILFKDLGADFSLISGSGSSFYGIFRDRKAALDAERNVKKDYPSAAVFAPLDKIPTVIVQ